MEPNHYIDLTPGDMIAHWADLAWVPVGVIVVARRHRLIAAAFAAACVFTLRAQLELMASTGHPRGLTTLLDGDPLLRGQIVYSLVILVFLGMVGISRKENEVVVLAAAIAMYLIGFCISMVFLAV